MSSNKKRKVSSIGTIVPHAIALQEKHLKDKGSSNIPISLNLNPPKEDDPHCWVSYEPKKYYPIGIVDENGAALNLPGVSIKESIDWVSEKGVETSDPTAYEQCVCECLKGPVYWFAAIKPHVPGKIKLSFSCPSIPDLAPLVFYIDVIDSEPPKKISKNLTVAPELVTKDDDIKVTEFSMKSRIERLPASCVIKLKGPILSITLKTALVVALLDDRNNAQSGQFSILDSVIPSSPSVSDIITTVLTKNNTELHSSTPLNAIGQSLLSTFDTLLEPVLLYPEERIKFEELKETYRKQHKQPLIKYSEFFGAIYLLRLIVALIQKTNNDTSNITCNTRAKSSLIESSAATLVALTTDVVSGLQVLLDYLSEYLYEEAHKLF